MKKSIKVTRVDHSYRFFLGSHTLVNEVASNLKSCLSCSLTVSGLKHIKLAVLNGELHILHISVMILKGLANIFKLCKCLGELLLHLCDVHGSTNACNNVLALSVCKELTEEALSAGSRVTCECNACAAIIAHVAECH